MDNVQHILGASSSPTRLLGLRGLPDHFVHSSASNVWCGSLNTPRLRCVKLHMTSPKLAAQSWADFATHQSASGSGCAELRKNIGHGGALDLLLVRHMPSNSACSVCDERTGIGDWSFTCESIPRPIQCSNHQRDAHTQQRAWPQAVPPTTTEGPTFRLFHIFEPHLDAPRQKFSHNAQAQTCSQRSDAT